MNHHQTPQLREGAVIIAILLFFIFLLSGHAQQRYFVVGTEIDLKNTYEGDYNALYKVGFTGDGFRSELFYEHHNAIKYQSIGINTGPVFNSRKIIKIPVLLQMSFIDRTKAFTPSFGMVTGIEIHLWKLVFNIVGEAKYRTDFEKQYGNPKEMRYSLRSGIQIKI